MKWLNFDGRKGGRGVMEIAHAAEEDLMEGRMEGGKG